MANLPPPQPTSGPLNTEPVITLTTIYAVLGAIVVLLTAFGIDIDQAKKDAIYTVVGVVFPLIGALHIRSIVFSPHSVKKIEDKGGKV